MEKRLKIECPECGAKIGSFGISDLSEDFGNIIYAVDCPNPKCGWSRFVSLTDVQEALARLAEPPKGSFKVFWDKDE